jgi:hypothetical protein
VIGLVLPLRADMQEETVGLDVNQHGEEAYIHGEGLTQAVSQRLVEEKLPIGVKSPVMS